MGLHCPRIALRITMENPFFSLVLAKPLKSKLHLERAQCPLPGKIPKTKRYLSEKETRKHMTVSWGNATTGTLFKC